jgi:hypothetical protein
MECVQEFQFDEIDPAFLVEPVRNFDPAMSGIEIARVTRGQNYVVENGLHLHLIAAGLAAIITFGPRPPRILYPSLQTVLHVSQPVEIFAGRGKIMLPEKIPRRLDFRAPDGRAALDPLLQFFHQFPYLPPALFRGHVGDEKFRCSVIPFGAVTTVRLNAHPRKNEPAGCQFFRQAAVLSKTKK